MKQIIYADNAATTQLDGDALAEMLPFLQNEYGNASQPYSFARVTKLALRNSRNIIAECIGATPEEIYFTSGGSESNNWSIFEGSREDGEIITSSIEHHSVLKPCQILADRGHSVLYLPVTNQGLVQADELERQISKKTSLVSIMFANNEIGTIQPISELCELAHRYGVRFHTDAVQAIGHIKIDAHALGVDMLSASAHKFNGPKGIGFLYVKKGTPIRPHISGGAQEFNLRAGTENIASVVAMSIALKKNVAQIDVTSKHLKNLENIVLCGLRSANVDFLRNGTRQIPGNLNLSFQNANGETLLHRLDLMGIMVSTGSACDSVNNQISHVLHAIALPNVYAQGTIRISFGKNNTVEDAQAITNAIIQILKTS